MLETLSPHEVFRWFEALSAIPRGSGNMEQISAWCEAFAKARGLDCRRDQANNVIIRKPASSGAGSQEPVILQGHLDMVCVQENGAAHNWKTHGPALRTDGARVWAEGTSLGADNGIAVAMILALLDAADVVHPPLEAVLTTDEETGMAGAQSLDMALLTGRRMINLDAEEDGRIYVGCAGGNKVICRLPVRTERAAAPGWELRIDGLRGGHSGAEIHLGRANALKLLGRVLSQLQGRTALRIGETRGGQADNAIAAEALCRFTAEDASDVPGIVRSMEAVLRNEYRQTEPALSVSVKPADLAEVMDEGSTRRLLAFLLCAPQGIREMSPEVPGLPQTSVNLGVLTADAAEVYGELCIRSALKSQQKMLNEEVSWLVQTLGGQTTHTQGCPAWEVAARSVVRSAGERAYRQLFGKEAQICITHCGAECGVFADALPGLDCIAMGPDISHAHSTGEYLDVLSTERTWLWLLEILRDLAQSG